ncbi:amidohydrolase [Alkalihalobacillus sp. MEB130]|uniref:amidohydrolase family protein n=1 Tax=Alkalihalobacillus sp. MEB130 TaxID=2976704 RepID=UPI0028DD702B|nr:amidohydrolase family protein [Alkalihalobacillus sp. MEB130]MDT8862972.1 amidohydrolase [Alkalihalobacillus sp. MEB130]
MKKTKIKTSEGAKRMGEEPRLIDTDVHNSLNDPKELLPFLPKVWHQQYIESGFEIGGKPFSSVGLVRKDAIPPNGGRPASDPEFLIKHHIDPYNIDYAILTGTPYMNAISLMYDPDYGNALAIAINDWMVEKWLKVDPRYKGSIHVNFSDPVAAVKEIDRMASHPNMVQVIMCSAARLPFGQRYYHSIYEAAERNGLPVAVHPGAEGLGPTHAPTPAGYPTRFMEWENILPLNFMGHINSLVCEGVFEKFPNLKFVAIEGGISWLPHLMWRMDKNYKALRDTVPWLKKLPSQYIKEHVYLTTQPIEEPSDPKHLVQIFEMTGAEDIVMFSSDYAHWDNDNPKMALAPFPRKMKEKIAAKNAMQLYRLYEKVPEGGGVL